jgi:hypothetical protein
MHPKLAARIQQTIHHQQAQHFLPGHGFPPFWQLGLPELVQLQLPPQFTTQPAAAERSRPFQLHLAQLDLQHIDIGSDFPVVRKQAKCREFLLFLIEHLQRLAPGCLLAIVDLAQIHHRAMHNPPTRNAATLHNAEIPVLFAIFLTTMNFQVHACWQNARIFAAWKEGRSGLQSLSNYYV